MLGRLALFSVLEGWHPGYHSSAETTSGDNPPDSRWKFLSLTGFLQFIADGTAGRFQILKGNKLDGVFRCCNRFPHHTTWLRSYNPRLLNVPGVCTYCIYCTYVRFSWQFTNPHTILSYWRSSIDFQPSQEKRWGHQSICCYWAAPGQPQHLKIMQPYT